MTALRDARLQRALAHAPDADLRPAAGARDAIRRHALAAVGTPPLLPWWRRWWAGVGGHQPWNAAFATLLLAGVVTLLWHDQPVPQAGPESVDVAPSAPAAAPPPVPQARVPAAAPVAPPVVQKKTEPRTDAVVPEKAQAAPAAQDVAPPPAPAPAPPSAPSAEMRSAAPALESAAAPAAARRAPAPAAAGAAAPQMQIAPSAQGWTDVLVADDTRTARIERAQSVALPRLISQVLQANVSDSNLAAAGPPLQRLELQRDGVALGVLELAGSQARWLPAPGGGPVLQLSPAPAVLQALRDELARLTPR